MGAVKAGRLVGFSNIFEESNRSLSRFWFWKILQHRYDYYKKQVNCLVMTITEV